MSAMQGPNHPHTIGVPLFNPAQQRAVRKNSVQRLPGTQGGGIVAMAGDRVHAHYEVLDAPGQHVYERRKLRYGKLLLLEVADQHREEVTGWVVAREGLSGDTPRPPFIHVTVPVDD